MSLRGFLPRRAIIMVPRANPRLAAVPEPSAASEGCPLGQAHTLELTAQGDPAARLAFVAPGPLAPDELALLDKMIEALGLKRSQVCLIHAVECPACSAVFRRELERVGPQATVALGESATRAARAAWPELRLRPSFHPSELLRAPDLKREAWAHLLAVARELGLQIPSKGKKA